MGVLNVAKKVLFLVPQASMDKEELKYYSRLYQDVDFVFSDPFDATSLVQQKINEGTEIIAGRGNTAESIRKKFPDVHVVQIQVTGYDVIRTLKQADLTGATVAVITNNVDVSGLSIFEKLYSIRIIGYLRVPFAKLENTIRDAVLRGAQYILGGALTCRMTNELGISAKAIPLVLGPESMINAIHDIKQVQKAIEIENTRQDFLNRLLDSVDEGIISVGPEEKIMLANANAARMLEIPAHLAIGKAINNYFPEDIVDGEDTLVNIGEKSLLITRTPVIHGQQGHGAIYILHEPSHIASLESHIRREAFARGNHVARFCFKDIIGRSNALQEAVRVSKNYALTDANVLIVGETGSGKEMFAQSIHNSSTRRKGTFVAVNCAALPENLLESELFGYVEGAFTGASRKGKAGLFEAAHGGTIFLDEISEMYYPSQGRLLRVLQEKYIVRLGSHKIIPVDVRVIAATNQNLQELVRQNKFREDLYYRLNVLNLTVPPLRERSEDAIILLDYFLKNAGLNVSLDDDAISFLRDYQWHGNVREVNNLADRIAATITGPTVTLNQVRRLLDSQGLYLQPSTNSVTQRQLRETDQKQEIMNAIRQSKGHMGDAADILGINRSTLWRRMKKLNLDRNRI